jgi:proline iminopeptidase
MKNIFYMMAIFMFSMQGCGVGRFQRDGEYYFLKNKGAVMPVWVRGDTSSKVMVVMLHGGPGDTGHGYAVAKGFEMLEKDYSVVYWDQRNSGLSQGNPKPETMTLDQMAEDTDQIISLLDHLYPGKSIFLIGHSWGGTLGTYYVGTNDHQTRLKGWINLDGGVSDSLEVVFIRKWLLNKAHENLSKPGDKPPLWQEILDWYEKHPPGSYTSANAMPYWFVERAGGDVFNHERAKEINKTPYFELAFFSPFSTAYWYNRHHERVGDSIIGKVLSYPADVELKPQISNIQIPTLVIHGEQDGVVPVEVGEYVFDNLGTPLNYKHKVIVPECAHSPHYEQPEIFYQAMKSFIEQYK